MTLSGAIAFPLFIDGSAGRLFAIHVAPARDKDCTGEAVLYLPPFAEEMNRARRMAVVQARVLAARGVGTLIFDPYGTGDSEGDFEKSGWEIWQNDTRSGLAWLHARGYRRCSLLGLRLGACLALDVAAKIPDIDLSRLVLWQPVQRGEIFLNQFLRIRIAADLRDGAGTGKETVSALRRRLAQGEILEIAGYGLTPELATAIDAMNIVDLALKCSRPIAWIELAPQAETGLTPASQAAIERLSGAGLDVRAEVVIGPPFWSIEETTLIPELCERTAELWNDPVR